MTSTIFIIILSLLISKNVAITSSSNGIHDRIFNGIEAEIGQFPYMVLVLTGLFEPTKRPSICSGSLIGFNTILTAAHCFRGLAPFNVVVMVGKADARNYVIHRSTRPFNVKYNSRTLQEAIAQKIHIHPNFNRNYDMAIVKIAIAFYKTKYVNTIPFTLDEYPLGMPCNISGYGKNEDGDAGRLAYFTTTEVQNDLRRCGLHSDDPIYYCLKRHDPDEPKACKGDSGAPLVYNNKVYGIHVRYRYLAKDNESKVCGAPGKMKLISLAASKENRQFLSVHSQELSKSNHLLPQYCVFITVLLFFGCKL